MGLVREGLGFDPHVGHPFWFSDVCLNLGRAKFNLISNLDDNILCPFFIGSPRPLYD